MHLPTRRADVDLRRRDALQGGRHAARHPRRHANTAPAPRATGRRRARCCSACKRGDRRELRAHSPLEPHRHGRAAAAVPAGPERAVAGPDRPRSVRHHRPDGAAMPRRSRSPRRRRRRQADQLQGACAHRHAEGARVLPARRHPAVRAAPARGSGPPERRTAPGQRSRALPRPCNLAVFDLDGTITRHDTLAAVRDRLP